MTIEAHPNDSSDHGGLRISLCYIEDTVQILAALRTRDAIRCLNVASGEVWNIAHIAEEIGKALSRPPNFRIEKRPRAGDLIADIGLLQMR